MPKYFLCVQVQSSRPPRLSSKTRILPFIHLHKGFPCSVRPIPIDSVWLDTGPAVNTHFLLLPSDRGPATHNVAAVLAQVRIRSFFPGRLSKQTNTVEKTWWEQKRARPLSSVSISSRVKRLHTARTVTVSRETKWRALHLFIVIQCQAHLTPTLVYTYMHPRMKHACHLRNPESGGGGGEGLSAGLFFFSRSGENSWIS